MERAQEVHALAVVPAGSKQVVSRVVAGCAALVPSLGKVQLLGEFDSSLSHSAACVDALRQQPGEERGRRVEVVDKQLMIEIL